MPNSGDEERGTAEMGRHQRRLRQPASCPQCESLVFEYYHWRPDLFSEAYSYTCSGCGYEAWEITNDLGERQHGETWATCGCCGRVLRSGDAALNGYGERCGAGKCHCHHRQRQSFTRRPMPIADSGLAQTLLFQEHDVDG